MAEVELSRPAGISDASWSSLQALDSKDHPGALAIATQINGGGIANPDAFVTGAIADRYRSVTSSGSGFGASVARFGKVIPFRPSSESIDPAADKALNQMATVDMANGDARAGLVSSIGVAINPAP